MDIKLRQTDVKMYESFISQGAVSEQKINRLINAMLDVWRDCDS